VICTRCGGELKPSARFCGACGAQTADPCGEEPASTTTGPTVPTAPRSANEATACAKTPIRDLCECLSALAHQLPHFEAHAAVVEAVTVAGSGPGEQRHTTVILGEKGRGKTTLANRLLGGPVLPTGRKGFRCPVPVRWGSAWRIEREGQEAETNANGPPFIAGEGTVRFVEGPASLLAQTTLIDAPGMNDGDADFDDVVIREALRADLVVFCLSAAQLLSESERVVIHKRLLPVTACELVLAVTHMDLVQSVEERQEIERRVRRFAARAESSRLSPLFLQGTSEASQPALELEQVIVRSAAAANPASEQRWAGRILALLSALQSAAVSTSEQDALVGPSTADAATEMLCVLNQEHVMALEETEVWLRSRLAQLRLALPERFAVLSPEAMKHEGAAALTGEIQSLGREAAAYYLSTLERELTALAGLKTAAEGLSRTAAERFAAVAPEAAVDFPERTRPSGHGKTAALAGVGVLLLATLPIAPVAPVLGAAAITFFAAHRIRRVREVRFTENYREEAGAAVREWLAAVEVDYLAQLRAAADELLTALRQRVLALKPISTPAGERPTRAEFQSQLQWCLERCRAVLTQGEH
jgi:hypothetical protein